MKPLTLAPIVLENHLAPGLGIKDCKEKRDLLYIIILLFLFF